MTDSAAAVGAQAAGVAEYMATVREAADRYLELGWSVIPILPDTKKPAITWTELQDRQPTEEEVEEWFTVGVPDGKGGRTTFFGLGVITGASSGLVVLDCDNTDALAYALGEAALWSPLGTKTTRGQHIYFKHPGKGERVINKAGGIGIDWPDVPGLDLRGDGGYVVVPPTIKFDGEGKFLHRYSFTVSDAELIDAVFGLPTWPGLRSRTATPVSAPPVDANGEFSLESLRLDGIRTYGASVWDEAGKRVASLGHKMRDGDGRNAWLTRYLGECVASGMAEEQAAVAAGQFEAEFFEVPLPQQEVGTILRSVISIDKRNHPEKYEAAPGYKNQTPERAARAKAIRLITPSSLAELKKLNAGRTYLIDPYLPPQAIVQVVGFNGHGKSLFLLNLLWAASLGVNFGPATIHTKLRVLYLDHESSGATIQQRIDECATMLGPMSESMTMWVKSLSDIVLNFNEAEAYTALNDLLKEVKPQIVVIDTVREAWLGMEENSPHAWVKVNQLAVALRNAGMTVVLVHHRNKPNQNGVGREAGSTAQLKDLDQQIFVTKVIEDADQARREAALPDEATQVVDFSGNVRSAYSYLRLTLPPGYQLKVVFETTFGKVRSTSENHVPAYIGIAQHMTTGARCVVSTKTPRQKALALHQGKGMQFGPIADALQVPLPAVERWIEQDIAAEQARTNA